jgi:hypothetical protein
MHKLAPECFGAKCSGRRSLHRRRTRSAAWDRLHTEPSRRNTLLVGMRACTTQRAAFAVQLTITPGRQHAARRRCPDATLSRRHAAHDEMHACPSILCAFLSSAPYVLAANTSATPSLATAVTIPTAGTPAQPSAIAGSLPPNPLSTSLPRSLATTHQREQTHATQSAHAEHALKRMQANVEADGPTAPSPIHHRGSPWRPRSSSTRA